MKKTKAIKGWLRLRRIAALAAVASSVFVFPASAQIADWAGPLAVCWESPNLSGSSSEAASDNTSVLFIPKSNRTIQALDAITGGLLWTIEYSGDRVSAPLYVDGFLVFASVSAPAGISFPSRKATVFRVDPVSGISSTQGEVEIGQQDSVRFDGRRLIIGKSGGSTALYTSDGDLIWDTDVSGLAPRLPFVAGDLIFISGEGGNVAVIGAGDGLQKGLLDLGSPSSGTFAYDKGRGRIFAGTRDGRVLSFEIGKERPIWMSRTGGAIQALWIVGTDVVAASGDNFVYRLAEGNGRRIWKRKLAGRILGGALLPGGLVAYTSLGSKEVAVLDLDDGKLVNRFEIKSGSYLTAPPLFAADRLFVRTDEVLTAIGPASECSTKKENEDARRTSSSRIR